MITALLLSLFPSACNSSEPVPEKVNVAPQTEAQKAEAEIRKLMEAKSQGKCPDNYQKQDRAHLGLDEYGREKFACLPLFDRDKGHY